MIRALTRILSAGAVCLALVACASQQRQRPCGQGGEAPRSDSAAIGTKQCFQMKDSQGRWWNHGAYTEWHPNGLRALEGEYRTGKKHGKWTEWDTAGKRVAERWYEDGVEVPNERLMSMAPKTAAPPPQVNPSAVTK